MIEWKRRKNLICIVNFLIHFYGMKQLLYYYKNNPNKNILLEGVLFIL